MAGSVGMTIGGGSQGDTVAFSGGNSLTQQQIVAAVRNLIGTGDSIRPLNVDAPGSNGLAGKTNVTYYTEDANASVTAGLNQQVVDVIGSGQDTLNGATDGSTLIYSGNDAADTFNVRATTVPGGMIYIHGGDGADILNLAAGTTVQAGLGAGSNIVNLQGSNLTIYDGGTYTVDVTKGADNSITDILGPIAINFSNGTTTSPTGGSGTQLLTLADNSTISVAAGFLSGAMSVSGGNQTVELAGNGEALTLTGAKDTINITGGSNTVTTFGAENIKITASGRKDNLMLGGKSTVSIDGTGSSTVTANGTKLSFALSATAVNLTLSGAHDTVSITAGKNMVSASGDELVKITGSGGADTLSVGSKSTIYAGGAKIGAVLVKSSDQTVTINGTDAVLTLSGSGDSVMIKNTDDTVNITAGKQSVTATKATHVKISGNGGNDTLSLAAGSTIALSGRDVIHLVGGGPLKIAPASSATIFGGSAALTFTAAKGGSDMVILGSGAATLTAGANAHETFVATDGNAVFKHGVGGTDLFYGGSKHDTMSGAGNDRKGSDTFLFESTQKGGTHLITAFKSGQDHIDLIGYSAKAIAAALANQKYSHGTAVITLADHTKITVTGLAHKLTGSDVI